MNCAWADVAIRVAKPTSAEAVFKSLAVGEEGFFIRGSGERIITQFCFRGQCWNLYTEIGLTLPLHDDASHNNVILTSASFQCSSRSAYPESCFFRLTTF